MLKEPQLRKKLQELGISTAGSRQMLERRHKEWMTIWNANCDSLHPRRKADLLHDLDVWERTLGTRAPTSSRSIHLGTQIKDKDFDGAAWAAKHDTSFRDLIASARKNRPKVRDVGKGSENREAEKGAGAGPEDSEEAPKRGQEPADTPPVTWTDAPRSHAPDAAIVDLTGDAAAEPTRSPPSRLQHGVAGDASLPGILPVEPRQSVGVPRTNGNHVP